MGQFRALLKKNWLLKKRKWKSTLAEILLPVFVMFFMIWIRSEIDITTEPAKHYYQTFNGTAAFGGDSNLGVEFNKGSRFPWSTAQMTQLFALDFTNNSKLIAIAPDNPTTRSFVQQKLAPAFGPMGLARIGINRSIDDVIKYFTDEESFNDYCKSEDYSIKTPEISVGIIFKFSENVYDYDLRFNITAATILGERASLPNRQVRTHYNELEVGFRRSEYSTYLLNGWMGAQSAVSEFILEENNITIPQVIFQPFPTKAHIKDQFALLVSALLGLFFTMVYLYPVTRISKLLVEEKELKIKEGMKMMGLKDHNLWGSWLLTYAGVFALTAILITIVTSASVYNHSDKFLVFLFFLLFGLNVFAFCYMLSSFFSRAKVAGTFGALLFLFSFFPYYTISGSDTTEGTKSFASLCSTIAFALSATTFANYESSGTGVQWSNIGTSYENFSIASGFGMLIFDFFLYMILGLYFDKVVKSEYGTSQPWNFCCRPSYYRKSELHDIELDDKDKEELEGIREEIQDKDLKPVVSIRKMRKVFNPDSPDQKTVAVRGLTLDLYEDQVTCLLGHNGAGKTTSLSMLTGLIPLTDGGALVNGKRIVSQMDEIRKELGVCPQHDILFDLLTVTEHLQLYAEIKGMARDIIPEKVTQIIEEVGLTEKVNTKSASLSGGQKRKLSVAIALIGDSKIIYLDEPTSGMDPYSRRSTWNLIKKKKKGRTIILTTHFMDEADYLGDRIAIMAKGQLKCCGSSLFLKDKYGVGYTMTVSKEMDGVDEKQQSESSLDIIDLVQQYVEEASVLAQAGSEISFRLPLDASGKFADMFDALDSKKEKFNIATYGLSVTTLEEVFLRVGHGDGGEKKDKEIIRKLSSQVNVDKKDLGLGADVETSKSVFWTHVKTLLRKRWNNQKRDRKIWVWQLVLPFLIMLGGVGLSTVAANFTFEVFEMNIQEYNQPLNIPINQPFDTSLGFNDLQGIDMTGYNNMSDYLLKSLPNEKNVRYGAYEYVQVANAYTIYVNTSGYHSVPVFYNKLINELLGSVNKTSMVYSRSLPITDRQRGQQVATSSIMISIGFAFIPASFIAFIVYERTSKSKHLQIISGVNIYAYWFSNFVWDLVNFCLPSILCILILFIYSIDPLTGEGLGISLLAMLMYGLAVIPFCYMLSFLFDNHTTAQNLTLLFYIFTGAILLMVSSILDVIPSTQSTNADLKYIWRLLPNYCFGEILLQNLNRPPGVGPSEYDLVGKPFVYLALEAVCCTIIVFIIEKILSSPDIMLKCRKPIIVEDEKVEEDVDVIAEREAIQRGDNALVQLKGLRKVYPGKYGAPPKVAVKDLYFKVKEGECFGFLGVNGAGKSTTLKMLTADVLPSTGDATLLGLSILKEQAEIRKSIGYCPQFDAILGSLTGRETFEMYAKIKGVADQQVEAYAQKMIDMLKIQEYADKPCGGYSGGNKRKVSVGISLIGGPKIVFLDEPSTGMDPASRRFMWSLISSTMKGRSVILTTHSMEECEALCQSIGIMVSGRLKCIGSAQHLKARFGTGYQIDVNGKKESLLKSQQFIEKEFNGKLIEMQGTHLKFEIPKIESLAAVFKIIESNREEMGIKEYSIGQSTLEQIFISFSKMQDEEKAVMPGVVEDKKFEGIKLDESKDQDEAQDEEKAVVEDDKDFEGIELGGSKDQDDENLKDQDDENLKDQDDENLKDQDDEKN